MKINAYFYVTPGGRLMILLPDRIQDGDEAEAVNELLRSVPSYDTGEHVVLTPADIEVFTTSVPPVPADMAEQIPD